MDPKRAAAESALDMVTDGMLLGLGTGSTAAFFIDALGARVAAGLRVECVATSVASHRQAAALGIHVSEQADRRLDLTVDGADEIDPALNLVKGLGGALLREKVVAAASARMVVVATDDKLVGWLGTRSPLPVEVLPLLWGRTAEAVGALGLIPSLRLQVTAAGPTDVPYVTDNGNLILDCAILRPTDPGDLAGQLDTIPGVLGHGLFVGLATQAIVAGPDGVRLLDPA
ncbi:MAG: ribose-5-phosphate isomerase RpiA [Candidatus Dormibacteria bacterium]